MNESMVLGAVIFILWAFIAYLRVPAVVLFLSILVGKLFAEELSLDTYNFITGFFPGLNAQLLQISLLILPAFLTVLFLKGSVPKSMSIINALPLLLCLVTLGLFINPYFDVVSSLQEHQRIMLTDNQSYIVSLAGALTLLSAWLPSKPRHRRHSKKH
jgi:hypothetical protein